MSHRATRGRLSHDLTDRLPATVRVWGVGLIFLFALVACGATGERDTLQTPARILPGNPTAPSDEWETYRSERGGFSVEYPATWTVQEQIDARGALVITLRPPGGAGISVIVQSGTSAETGNPDLMNTRCHPRTVGGRTARTCLDTISFTLTTTVVGQGKTYIITSSRKRGDQKIYDQILASFRILP